MKQILVKIKEGQREFSVSDPEYTDLIKLIKKGLVKEIGATESSTIYVRITKQGLDYIEAN
ncbi:hypothetical protein [Chryseobacterium sediminis]|uniref:Uncharacterized protein n=1 Tax=Chryseobacterium sediminis TaxID=1679494 RepID=A0A5B2U8W5_9FLAO|nr:hypothetical protein [Chryseobacterium sediminis]KAA2222992.1 hypothetical protein FW780_01970 [Chryseobacterium sediminis]